MLHIGGLHVHTRFTFTVQLIYSTLRFHTTPNDHRTQMCAGERTTSSWERMTLGIIQTLRNAFFYFGSVARVGPPRAIGGQSGPFRLRHFSLMPKAEYAYGARGQRGPRSQRTKKRYVTFE